MAEWFKDGPFRTQTKDRRFDSTSGIEAHRGVLAIGQITCNPKDNLVLVQNSTSSTIQLTIKSRDKDWQLNFLPGSIFFVAPATSVTIELSQSFSFLALSIPSKLIKKNYAKPITPLVGQILPDPFGMQALPALWQELDYNKPYRRIQIEGINQILVACFLNTLEHLAQTSNANHEIRHIVNWLQDNLHKKITSAELSKLTKLSVPIFQKNFKNTYGLSVSKYITRLRIQKAQKLVLEGRENYAEIAIECGFHDQSHMTHIFKKQFGCTPGSFRNSRALLP